MIILTETICVPFVECKKAISRMHYASTERVMFIMLVLTGCRLQALDTMFSSWLINGVLYYHPGKNQKQYLKTPLPNWYLKELCEYRKNHRIWGDHLFSCTADAFRRYFVRIRPSLGYAWTETALMPHHNLCRESYVLQLKGIRKMFWTMEFKRQLEEWKDAGVALEMTSKKAAHSTTHMTAYHYLRDFAQIGKQQGDITDLLGNDQKTLLEY